MHCFSCFHAPPSRCCETLPFHVPLMTHAQLSFAVIVGSTTKGGFTLHTRARDQRNYKTKQSIGLRAMLWTLKGFTFGPERYETMKPQ